LKNKLKKTQNIDTETIKKEYEKTKKQVKIVKQAIEKKYNPYLFLYKK